MSSNHAILGTQSKHNCKRSADIRKIKLKQLTSRERMQNLSSLSLKNWCMALAFQMKRKNENRTPADNLEPPAGTCGSNLPQPATSLNQRCHWRLSTVTLEQHLSTTARFFDVNTFLNQVVHVGQNLLGRPPASLVSSKLPHFSLFVLFSPTFRCAAVLRLSD